MKKEGKVRERAKMLPCGKHSMSISGNAALTGYFSVNSIKPVGIQYWIMVIQKPHNIS